MNLKTYVRDAINGFTGDRRSRRRSSAYRTTKRAWAWSRRHPTTATWGLLIVGLLVLFASLAWGFR
jgi:hypothetical protein